MKRRNYPGIECQDLHPQTIIDQLSKFQQWQEIQPWSKSTPQRYFTVDNLGKVVNFSPKFSVIPTSFLFWLNFWMTPKWRNEARMTGMKSRKTSFFPEVWDDGNDRNALWMTEIVILTSFLSFQHNVIPRHSNARMTIEWMKWHPNDSIFLTWLWLMEWHSNGRMKFKWWSDIQMMEWHSNDETILKWWKDDGMI